MTSRHSPVTHTLWYLLPSLVSGLVPLATFPILTRTLTTDDYGAWGLAVAYGVVASGVANLGLTVGYERNFFDHTSENGRGALLYSVLAFAVIMTLAAGLATWYWREAIARAVLGDAAFGSLVVVAFAANSVTGLKAYYLLYLKNTRQARLHTWYSVDETVVSAVVAVVLVLWFGWGPMGLVAGHLAAATLVLALVAARVATQVRAGWSMALLGDALAVSWPLMPRVFLGVVGNQFDKYLLGQLSSIGVVGIYTAGQRLAYLVFQGMTALGNVFTPTVYERLMASPAHGPRAVGGYLTPFAWVAAGGALVVSAFAAEALWVLAAGEFRAAAPIVSLLAVSYGLLFFGKIPQLTVARRTGLISVVTVVSLAATVSLNLWLVPWWGATGAALAALGATMVSTALALWLGQRVCPVDWQTRQIAPAFLLLALGGAVSAAVAVSGVWWGPFVRVAIVLAFLAAWVAGGHAAAPLAAFRQWTVSRGRS